MVGRSIALATIAIRVAMLPHGRGKKKTCSLPAHPPFFFSSSCLNYTLRVKTTHICETQSEHWEIQRKQPQETMCQNTASALGCKTFLGRGGFTYPGTLGGHYRDTSMSEWRCAPTARERRVATPYNPAIPFGSWLYLCVDVVRPTKSNRGVLVSCFY